MHLDIPPAVRKLSDIEFEFSCRFCGDVLGHGPTPRWYPVSWHPVIARLMNPQTRHLAAYAGRRSFKTEASKRKIVQDAFELPGAFLLATAPIHQQAKKIWFKDIKDLIPKRFLLPGRHGISLSDREFRLVNGTVITVAGLDNADRIEGIPWDRAYTDESASVKPDSITMNLLPALDTLGADGRLNMKGVPEGRAGDFFKLCRAALSDPEWSVFHWTSESILPPETLDAAKRRMSDLQYRQEYLASFISFAGQVFDVFDPSVHASHLLRYDPSLPLEFSWDFNVNAFAVVVSQQQLKKDGVRSSDPFVAVIGEVAIMGGANIRVVVEKLHMDWSKHKGPIYIYGDPTGGARNVQAESVEPGGAWRQVLERMSQAFDNEIYMRVKCKRYGLGHPPKLDQMLSLHSALMPLIGDPNVLFCPRNASTTIGDIEALRWLDGAEKVEVDKSDPATTHWADAISYRFRWMDDNANGASVTDGRLY